MITADVLAFETGAPHAGAHPFDDQVALQLSDGAIKASMAILS